MQSKPQSFILSQKNQQISCWKEMDWGGVWQIRGVVEVDIQRAVSVIPTNGEILSTSAICRTSFSFCQLEHFWMNPSFCDFFRFLFGKWCMMRMVDMNVLNLNLPNYLLDNHRHQNQLWSPCWFSSSWWQMWVFYLNWESSFIPSILHVNIKLVCSVHTDPKCYFHQQPRIIISI